MAWNTIEPDNLKGFMSARQYDALTSKQIADGQEDPFETVNRIVCQMIRAAIVNGGKQICAHPDTIPDTIKVHAIYLVIEALIGREPDAELTTVQSRAVDRAYQMLEHLAKGQIKIETPLNADTESFQANDMTPAISARHRKFTPDNMEGL